MDTPLPAQRYSRNRGWRLFQGTDRKRHRREKTYCRVDKDRPQTLRLPEGEMGARRHIKTAWGRGDIRLRIDRVEDTREHGPRLGEAQAEGTRFHQEKLQEKEGEIANYKRVAAALRKKGILVCFEDEKWLELHPMVEGKWMINGEVETVPTPGYTDRRGNAVLIFATFAGAKLSRIGGSRQ